MKYSDIHVGDRVVFKGDPRLKEGIVIHKDPKDCEPAIEVGLISADKELESVAHPFSTTIKGYTVKKAFWITSCMVEKLSKDIDEVPLVFGVPYKNIQDPDDHNLYYLAQRDGELVDSRPYFWRNVNQGRLNDSRDYKGNIHMMYPADLRPYIKYRHNGIHIGDIVQLVTHYKGIVLWQDDKDNILVGYYDSLLEGHSARACIHNMPEQMPDDITFSKFNLRCRWVAPHHVESILSSPVRKLMRSYHGFHDDADERLEDKEKDHLTFEVAPVEAKIDDDPYDYDMDINTAMKTVTIKATHNKTGEVWDATAKCRPDDKFCVLTGVMVACQKLAYKMHLPVELLQFNPPHGAFDYFAKIN